MRPHPKNRLWTFVLVLGAFLNACQGDVLEPSDRAGNDATPGAGKGNTKPDVTSGPVGTGGRGSTPNPSGGGGTSAVSGNGNGSVVGGPPAPVPQAFTRLTRAEYSATVREALGAEVDATLVPVDGRIGPFTSNTGVSPDPVHPYLLAAEDLATALIPSKLPACQGSAAAACVRDKYREPFARLYRRPVTDAEVTSWAALISSLTNQGVSAEAATRAMLSAALMSPDFLFHSMPAKGDTTANGLRLAERLSYALWDAPPDAALTTAAQGTAADLGGRLKAQAARVTSDRRSIPVLARFLAQWLHLDTDLRLENPDFATSPRFLEWLALVEAALDSDMAVTELISGNQGFVHRDNLEAYGLSTFSGTANAELARITWAADSPRRGLLAQDLLADSTRHPDKSRRLVFRGRLVRASLLCDDIPPPPPDLIAAAGEVSSRTTDARCSRCHRLMDPIGKAFAALDEDDSNAPEPAEILSHSELAGTYPNLPALLDAVASSRAFAECFARNWLGFFLEQSIEQADIAWVAQLADAVQGGASLRDVIEQTIVTLEADSETIAPMCQGS
jgi:hypothetical protein